MRQKLQCQRDYCATEANRYEHWNDTTSRWRTWLYRKGKCTVAGDANVEVLLILIMLPRCKLTTTQDLVMMRHPHLLRWGIIYIHIWPESNIHNSNQVPSTKTKLTTKYQDQHPNTKTSIQQPWRPNTNDPVSYFSAFNEMPRIESLCHPTHLDRRINHCGSEPQLGAMQVTLSWWDARNWILLSSDSSRTVANTWQKEQASIVGTNSEKEKSESFKASCLGIHTVLSSQFLLLDQQPNQCAIQMSNK